MRAVMAEGGGITHRIMQCLNAAAMVAVHENLERISVELLEVHRREPGRVLAAQRAASGPRSSDAGAPPMSSVAAGARLGWA